MLLAFDFGMKVIGVASGQKITKTASPLTTISATDGIPNWQQIQQLVDSWRPEALIVGLPLNMDGTEQEITKCARKFANRLQEKYKMPVHLVDERLSTWQAKQETTKSTKNNRHDAIAAAILLEQWLNTN